MPVNVLRTRPVTPLDALNDLLAAGFMWGLVDEPVLACAPLFDDPEVDYDFVPIGESMEFIPWDKVPKHPADFVGMCAVLIKDRTILHAGSIAIQWVDEEGKTCYAFWYFWEGKYKVDMGRDAFGLRGRVRIPLHLKLLQSLSVHVTL